jgi:hypothetical protein
MARRGKTVFDAQVFVANVGAGKTKLEFQKNQNVFAQGDVADAVFYIQKSDNDRTELRRYVLRYARSFPPGYERNQHLQAAVSLRRLFRNEKWLRDHVRNDS